MTLSLEYSSYPVVPGLRSDLIIIWFWISFSMKVSTENPSYWKQTVCPGTGFGPPWRTWSSPAVSNPFWLFADCDGELGFVSVRCVCSWRLHSTCLMFSSHVLYVKTSLRYFEFFYTLYWSKGVLPPSHQKKCCSAASMILQYKTSLIVWWCSEIWPP